ncbi:hypothetical protein FCJ61_13020 [Burkholderia metallica]|uniref:hypothetical protein n=1 Tax=Burkholderia metallica TaxID=488729 RepID=UPI00157A42DB|nr:hypothetical protein [Burkholderia metallica]NTZ83892.1 hypothetical protein [Burkholderia metallica]
MAVPAAWAGALHRKHGAISTAMSNAMRYVTGVLVWLFLEATTSYRTITHVARAHDRNMYRLDPAAGRSAFNSRT